MRRQVDTASAQKWTKSFGGAHGGISKRLFARFRPGLLLVSCVLGGCATEATRVEFAFTVPHVDGNPFAREIWATVTKPSGVAIRVPAFWTVEDSFAVRIFPNETGRFRLSSIEEEVGDSVVSHPVTRFETRSPRVKPPPGNHFVRVDPSSPLNFSLDDGSRFVPLGGNIPWLPSPEDSTNERVRRHYQTRFRQFSEAGLNWARIWMVHWSRLNLDWLEEDLEQQPEPGSLESGVAENWDRILEMAEAMGVYVQVVFQHHGQYSTEVNPKWKFNPWNAANSGGILERPAAFFTSEHARDLTKRKYRYIVARWGYSPAVMAWELFNEVHWVDAMRHDFDEDAVAAWHTEMADYIRSIDAHNHLVTTSTDDIQSPIYASMDYLQPHIYPVDIIPNMRYVDPAYGEIGKPTFYGEFGDDHMPLTAEEKRSGVTIIPPIWAGLMGHLHIPPQTWFVERLIETGNLEKLAAVARFLSATKLPERNDLVPFSPPVAGDRTIPLTMTPGFVWMNRPSPFVEVVTDGSSPISHALVPGVLIADTLGRKRGFPDAVSFHTDFPRADTIIAHLRLRESGIGGTTAQLALDDVLVDSHTWPQADLTDEGRAAELVVFAPAGPRTITVRNTGGPAWFYLDRLETGFEVPIIGAVGKRGDDIVALWIWNREGVFATEPVAPGSATITIEDLPPGAWELEWWDTDLGEPISADILDHAGATLSLDTPEITRHVAVVLRRSDKPA